MIQRKQSLYLLLAAICYVLLFFFHIYILESSNPLLTAKLYINKILVSQESGPDATSLILPAILGGILIGGSLVNIFLFKNRMLQSKICHFLLLLGTGLLVAMFFSLDKVAEMIQTQEKPVGSYTFGVIFLALPLIFFFLANKSIQADDKMVKEADRLR